MSSNHTYTYGKTNRGNESECRARRRDDGVVEMWDEISQKWIRLIWWQSDLFTADEQSVPAEEVSHE